MALNKIFITGRLVADPELRTTPAGVTVTTFRIACERDFKNSAGERETDFINIVAWRQTGEFIAKTFRKSRLITIVGRLQMRPYTDKDGNNRIAPEVVAEQVYFADSRTSDGTASAPASSSGASGQFHEMEGPDNDGNLPF